MAAIASSSSPRTSTRSGKLLVDLLAASPLKDVELEHVRARSGWKRRLVGGWLLDTNVLSELRRARPSRRVAAFVGGESLDRLYVSVVTFAEIRFDIELVADPARRSELILWLDNKLRPMFDGRILEITEDVLLKSRLLIEDGRKRGHTFSHPDVLIAATAAHHDLTVVTHDVDEFQAAGVAVFDPWTGTASE